MAQEPIPAVITITPTTNQVNDMGGAKHYPTFTVVIEHEKLSRPKTAYHEKKGAIGYDNDVQALAVANQGLFDNLDALLSAILAEETTF